MSRSNMILAVALVLQVAVLGFSRLGQKETGTARQRPLLGIKADQISRIEITGKSALDEKKQERVVLERRAGKWVVASGGGYPVSGKRATTSSRAWSR